MNYNANRLYYFLIFSYICIKIKMKKIFYRANYNPETFVKNP
jgi:hypothetical protein